MLTNLQIQNYALIEALQLQPHQALNIITGETGAGKSIMLGAIGLLLGNRADLKVLFNPDEKCIIEGTFLVCSYNLKELFESLDLDYGDTATIRREISPNGKSRAFINDTPVNLETLKTVGGRLLDIHSQHDNLLLGSMQYQLYVVDAFADNKDLLTDYQLTYTAYNRIKNQYQKLQSEYANYQKEYDYNNFLLDELSKANIKAEELEELENELNLLERAEEVKTKLNRIGDYLANSEQAINDELKSMVSSLNQIADLSKDFETLRDRLESCVIELQDIASEINQEQDKIEFNPERIEEVQSRLSLLYHFLQKHQVKKLIDLLQIQADLQEKVNKVLNFDDEISQIKTQLAETQVVLMEKAHKLSKARQEVFETIESELKVLLIDLGMPNAVIKIQQTVVEPNPEGIDQVAFLFSANKGVAPQEISKVASGGEFSRLMLSIKYILAGKTALSTIIFDEIDTGISGEIALKMGKMFRIMSQKHQIIAISHLHQIAAKGDHHYFVYKDDQSERTISRIRQLNEQERIQEIAKMISGNTPSESAILSAKELLMVD